MNPEAVLPILQTTLNSLGQPIAYPREGTPEVTALLVEMAPGEETGWHRHPVPLLGYASSAPAKSPSNRSTSSTTASTKAPCRSK
jgi:hypothetical protein